MAPVVPLARTVINYPQNLIPILFSSVPIQSTYRLANVGDYLTCCLQLKTLSGGGDISETITELLEQLKNVLTGLVPQ